MRVGGIAAGLRAKLACIPVVFAISLVVLLVVSSEIGQAEPIMGGDKVDRVCRRSAALPLAAPVAGPPFPFCRLSLAVQSRAAAHSLGKSSSPWAFCALQYQDLMLAAVMRML